MFPGFTPSDVTDQHRTNFGLYADAETDLTPQLLADVAARFETYSDFGEQLTGKVALRYPAVPDRFTLRGAVEHRLPGAGAEPGVRSARSSRT